MLKFQRAVWDSDFFDKEISELVDASAPSSDCSATELAWAKVGADDYGLIDELALEGFQYVEGEVLLSKLVTMRSKLASDYGRLATAGDLNHLLPKVDGLYRFSRYRQPWFDECQRDAFYREWLYKAVCGDFDDCCFVSVGSNGAIQGFVTVRKKGMSGTIGLLGVFAEYQGQGVLSKLIDLAECWARSEGIDHLYVATQISNERALRAYINSGFNAESTSVWMYRT